MESIPNAGLVVSSATDPKLLHLGETIRRLLETGDVDAFALATSVSVDDWNEVLPKAAGGAIEHPLGDNPAQTLRRYRQAVADSGQRLLEIAQRCGLVGDRVRFQVKSVTARSGGAMIYDVAPGQHATVRKLESVLLIMTGEPTLTAAADAPKRGDYQISVGNVVGFPGGWRIQGGVQWKSFPAGVPDDATLRELTLIAKVAEDWREHRTLALADDDLLAKLGNAFVELLRRRSVPDFVAAVMMGQEEMREFEKKLDWGTADETEQRFRGMTQEVTASAQGMLDTLERLGIDLSDAEISLKEATADKATFGQWTFGSPDGLRSHPIRFTFRVQSERKSREGRSIAGDYVVATGDAMRKDGRWILLDDQTRWQELPSKVMTKPERERIDFENHVIERGTLPIGTPAPDIALVRLDTGANVQLSAYRGKVVVLEWWASWCGPCQPAMAELQTLREAHPKWKDRVEIVAVSIDDELKLAQEHVAKRQWTKTTNVWAGAGGINSAAQRSFRVRGVPTLYIIDAKGRIVAAGHPMALPVADLVNKALPD